MIESLNKARTAHTKHHSSHFEVPGIVDGNVRAKCLKCKIYSVATGGNLSRHVCQPKKDQNNISINLQQPPPAEQFQGPNPPETQPTIAEVLEENRQCVPNWKSSGCTVHCFQNAKVPKKISPEKMIELLNKARTAHTKHHSSHFEVPGIVDGNPPPAEQFQGPNPPETQPTIAEVLEENRQCVPNWKMLNPLLGEEVEESYEIVV
ncbi:hypothetical protein DAPPUDRAFT_233581 [Daphnia pulex]|uniref:Uncharacterized protein n=1 Tax=Daphnia pulex TaxID=6669 RepID=E9FV66_DAPPU|nr:hypothetical protein DAPPUDRAFT_233581 [Daphnia pulex]|eukprot:EFX88502.1 hypothetical protein DAPPUDRAFT_233581 [Daphnia pulex]